MFFSYFSNLYSFTNNCKKYGFMFYLTITGPSRHTICFQFMINPLNTELNSICHLVALLEAHPILHVSRIRINSLYMFSAHLLIIRRHCICNNWYILCVLCQLTANSSTPTLLAASQHNTHTLLYIQCFLMMSK
jgi:hypothetical protein